MFSNVLKYKIFVTEENAPNLLVQNRPIGEHGALKKLGPIVTEVVCQTIIQNSDSQTVRQSDEGQRWKYKNLSTSPPTTLPSSSGVAPASRFGGGAGSNPGIFISNWETSCSWEEIGYKFQHRFENYPHQGTSGWAVGQCIPKRRDQPYLRVPEMWLH